MKNNSKSSNHDAKVINKKIHFVNEPILHNIGSFNNFDIKKTSLHNKNDKKMSAKAIFIVICGIFLLTIAYLIFINYFYKNNNFSNNKISISIPKDADYNFKDKSSPDFDLYEWSNNNQTRPTITVRIENTQKNTYEETEYLDSNLSESYFLQNYSKSNFSIKNFIITESQRMNMNARDVQFDLYRDNVLYQKLRELYIVADYKITMLLISAEPSDTKLIDNTDSIIDSFTLN
jgi:hypothetical protein